MTAARPVKVAMSTAATRGRDPAVPLATPPRTEEPPRIPGYAVERVLGMGGMGMVHLARHETLQRLVALKVMRADLARDPQYAARFLREARAAARLAHPAVVQIHDAGEAGGHLYLAMEYLPGGDLRRALADGPLAEAEALAAIATAAEGMAAIHRAGLVHRDLKPENLLRDAEGRVKVGDLGLARPTHGAPTGNEAHVTVQGDALGTPAYMAPEQAQGAADLDARCDVYGLAATLYSLLTAQPPFTGPTTWAVVNQVISAPAPDARAVNPAVSGATAALVMRAMAKERAARPAGMEEFAAEIAACRAGLPGDRRLAPTALLPGVPGVPVAARVPEAAVMAPAVVAGPAAPVAAGAPVAAAAAPRGGSGFARALGDGLLGGLRLLALLAWGILRAGWWVVGGILGMIFRLLWRGWRALSIPWRLATLAVAVAGLWMAGLAVYTWWTAKPTPASPGARLAAGTHEVVTAVRDEAVTVRNAVAPPDHPRTQPPPGPDAARPAVPARQDPDQNPFHALRDAIRGSLVKDVAGDVATLDARVMDEVAARKWPLKKHQRDDDGSAEISVATDGDATLTVNLDPLPGGQVRVRLRVGAFGDQERQQALYSELFP
jgi:hypothetical protein